MVQIAGRQLPKWLVALVAVLLIGVVSGTLSRCAGGALERERAKNAATQTSQPKPTTPSLPAFRVVEVEDVSVGATPRLDYRVAVSGQPTPEQLSQIATVVFGQAKARQPFAALRVGFYDYAEYAGREFTLGVVEYAPNGDWTQAASIEPGEYDSMEANADLPTKDWSKQLTPEEVEIWAAWWAEYDVAAKAIGANPSKSVDEDSITKKVAKSTGKSAKEVLAILTKQQVWASK